MNNELDLENMLDKVEVTLNSFRFYKGYKTVSRKRGKSKIEYYKIISKENINNDIAKFLDGDLIGSFQLYLLALSRKALKDKKSILFQFLDKQVKIEYYGEREAYNPKKKEFTKVEPRVQIKMNSSRLSSEELDNLINELKNR